MEKVVSAVVLALWVQQVQACSQQVFFSTNNMTQATCQGEHDSGRTKHIMAAHCAEPRDVLVYLNVDQSHVQISPGAVFVKQCVGVCNSANMQCLPQGQSEKMIPVRYHDISTGKEGCVNYPVTEHLSCGCRKLKPVTRVMHAVGEVKHLR